MCNVLRESSMALDTGFFILLICLWYVRKLNVWLRKKKSIDTADRLDFCCLFTVPKTNPTFKLGLPNNLYTYTGGNKVTLVKVLFLVQTLTLVKQWKLNHKLEEISDLLNVLRSLVTFVVDINFKVFRHIRLQFFNYK